MTAQLGANAAPPTDIPDPFEPNPAAKDHREIVAMIPMRDGIRLHTLVLIPDGAPTPAPMLLTRTPYGVKEQSKVLNPSSTLAAGLAAWMEDFVDAGYIVVLQDVRGKFQSEGAYLMGRAPGEGETDHVTDTWDTVEWLVQNVPGNNRRVGITGVSYSGYLSFVPLLDPHPALRAAVPVNALVDAWIGDDFYHNGAFRLFELEYFYRQTSSKDNAYKPPYGHYDVFAYYLAAGNAETAMRRLLGETTLPAWDRLARRSTYDGVWQAHAVDHDLAKLERLSVPTLNVHAWFDAEDIYGPVAAHAALRDKPGEPYHFVAGPWNHGQCMIDGSASGKIRWDSDTALWFRRRVMLPFLDHHLRDMQPAEPLPPVIVFETGANEWRTPAAWPPREAAPRELYLEADGGLSFEPPTEVGADPYHSDPAKPIPFRVRPIVSRHRDSETWGEWLLDDQRSLADRPDVLVYTSSVLRTPVTIAGEVTATLFASTTGSDADWVVKLIDVYPDEYPRQPELGGYQLIISADIMRARFREGFEHARPVPSGAVLEYSVRMPHAYHTFQRGHRIMVQIHSTWFPIYDRNPQTFVDVIHDAPPESYRLATHTIYRGGDQASRIHVSTLG